MKKMMFSLLAAAGLLTITGCQSKFNENDVVSIAPDANVTVTFDVKELQDYVRIYTIRSMKSESGIRSVSVRGRLRRDGFFSWFFQPGKNAEMMYHFSWFTADGKDISTAKDLRWRWLKVYPGEDFSVGGTAPSIAAVKAVLHINYYDGAEQTTTAKSSPLAKKMRKAEAATPEKKLEAREKNDQTTVSASELNQEVKRLRADIQKQIKLDPNEPGVSLSDTDTQASAAQIGASQREANKTASAVTAAAKKADPKAAPKAADSKTAAPKAAGNNGK